MTPLFRGLAFVSFVAVVFIAACGDDESPVGPTPLPCTYSLSASQAAFATEGGTVTLSVTTGAECVWSATTSASWATIKPASATGPGTVTLTAASNEPEQARRSE